MAFQPLMCLFILFADDVFQTENVWALIGTYLLSLILDAVFIIIYLIVMLTMNIRSIGMPTFKYSLKEQRLERRRLLFKVFILPLFFALTLSAMSFIIYRLSSDSSRSTKTRNLVVFLVTQVITFILVLLLVLIS
jgi:hypothetical protein